MPDRVRQVIFDMLGAHYSYPGHLPAIATADVFAGSGSMGIEALSRGVATCHFFERDRTAVAVLRKNLDTLGAQTSGTVHVGDAWNHPPGPDEHASFALVFLDPPYADSDDAAETGSVARYLHRMADAAEPGTLVVLHHRRSVDYAADRHGWRTAMARNIGSNGVTFFEKTEPTR